MNNQEALALQKARVAQNKKDLKDVEKKIKAADKEITKFGNNYKVPKPSTPMPLAEKASQMQTFRKQQMPEPANDDGDVVDAVENQTAQTTTQTDVLKSIDDKMAVVAENSSQKEPPAAPLTKLDGFSNKLSQKYQAANDSAFAITSNASTSEAIKDMPTGDDVNTDDKKKPEDVLFPETKKPKASSGLVDEKKKSGKELESVKKANPMLVVADKTLTVLTLGFKAAKKSSDIITNILSKMGLAQVAQAAKVGLAVFAIVAAIDIIRAYWAKWGDEIMVKLTEWGETIKGWYESFTTFLGKFDFMFTSFETMSANFMDIRDAWMSGDFPALAKSIGSGIIDLAKTFEATLTRAVTKIISNIMRLIPGLGGAADKVEAFGLEHYQNATDGRLSKEDQTKLAKSQVDREEKDNKTATERGWTDFLPNSFRHKVKILSDAEMKQIESEKKDQNARKDLSYDDKVKNTAATNEAREALQRYKKFADSANPSNKNDMDKLDKYKNEAKLYISNGDLSKTPETKAELQRQFDSIKIKKANVQPAPSSQSADAQTVTAIKTNESKAKAAKESSGGTTANVQNNIVKNNKNVHVQAPVTSTNAPGVYKANGIN